MEEIMKQSALPHILQSLLNIAHDNETEQKKNYMEDIILSAVKIDLCDGQKKLTLDTSFFNAVNAYYQHRYHLNNRVELPSKLQIHTKTTSAHIRHIDELPKYLSQHMRLQKLEAEFVNNITTWTKTHSSTLLNTTSHSRDIHPVIIEKTINEIIYQATCGASTDEDSNSDWENLNNETGSHTDTAEDFENYYQSPYDPNEAYNGRKTSPLRLLLAPKRYRNPTPGL
jgi:hypothetical protein